MECKLIVFVFFRALQCQRMGGRVCVCARTEEESFENVKTIEGIDRVLYCQYTCPFVYGFNFRMACNGSTRQFLAVVFFYCDCESYSNVLGNATPSVSNCWNFFFSLSMDMNLFDRRKKNVSNNEYTHMSHLKRCGRTRNPTDNNGTD